MLAQRYRFHGYGSLKFLYRTGSVYRSRSLALRITRNDRRPNSRCAVIVTKKVQKAAPRRNRIRRRVYEIIRTEWDHIQPSHDMLITVYDPLSGEMDHEQLRQGVIELLKQSGVWREL